MVLDSSACCLARRPHALETGALFAEQRDNGVELSLEQLDALRQDGFYAVEDLDPLSGVVGGEVLATEYPPLVLRFQESAYVSQAEADDVTQPLDEVQAFDVLFVVAAIGATDVRGGFEQPELFVVADGARRERGEFGNVTDAPHHVTLGFSYVSVKNRPEFLFSSRKLRLAPQGSAPWTPQATRVATQYFLPAASRAERTPLVAAWCGNGASQLQEHERSGSAKRR